MDAGLRLRRLTLTSFRNYAALTWRPTARVSVLFGANGSGKTNLLEAVSLLAPGRGLRGARLADFVRHGDAAWAVAGQFATPEGLLDVGTGSPPEGPADRRVFRLDGVAPRSQAEIAARVAMVWLTPQMDRLFGEGPSGRRRFLDRLVYALEPSHAREVAAHDAAMAQRNRLLAEGGGDPVWLAALEEVIAQHAVAATAARALLVARLNAALAAGVAGAFPPARLSLLCPIAERLATGPALAVEDWLREALAAGRAADGRAGMALLGAHRADMGLARAEDGLAAALASTGQQKALLVGVVLGHAALLAEARGFAPLLLLDEVTVHLDAFHRRALFAALRAASAQVLLTGTDRETFLPLGDFAEGLSTGGNCLRADPGFCPPSPGCG
jgi:DNA replication and repair protein RecF